MTPKPVEEIQPGDRIVLPVPGGRPVTVERVDSYEIGGETVFFVRWVDGPKLGPGHRLHGQRAELGSLKPLRVGETFEVSE